MYKIIFGLLLSSSLIFGIDFPLDASYCSSSARKLKNYADELESQESDVESEENNLENAKSDYELNCGNYGSFSGDESMCGNYGMYRTSYEDALNTYNNTINDYNSALSDLQYQLKSFLRNCQ